jgi:hypothetical protein
MKRRPIREHGNSTKAAMRNRIGHRNPISNASQVASRSAALSCGNTRIMSRDHWRITTAAIQLEMERIAGLLQKSTQFQSRTSTPHPLRQRHEAEPAAELIPQP